MRLNTLRVKSTAQSEIGSFYYFTSQHFEVSKLFVAFGYTAFDK